MLPIVTTLVTRSRSDNTCQSSRDNSAPADKTNDAPTDKTGLSMESPRRYYAVVESDHPYKPAAVHNYRVTS